MNSNTNTNTNQIIFIDSRVQDIPSLLAGFSADAEVHVIDASQDGLAQMNELLAGRSGLDAIHLIGHGSAGNATLGSTTLSNANLSLYQAPLAELGSHLSSTGDLLLYGCDIAQGDAGQAFIQQIAQLTGADVAASTDLTGAAGLGGDWVLEANSGVIDSSFFAPAYDYVLATDPGDGKYRIYHGAIVADSGIPYRITLSLGVGAASGYVAPIGDITITVTWKDGSTVLATSSHTVVWATIATRSTGFEYAPDQSIGSTLDAKTLTAEITYSGSVYLPLTDSLTPTFNYDTGAWAPANSAPTAGTSGSITVNPGDTMSAGQLTNSNTGSSDPDNGDTLTYTLTGGTVSAPSNAAAPERKGSYNVGSQSYSINDGNSHTANGSITVYATYQDDPTTWTTGPANASWNSSGINTTNLTGGADPDNTVTYSIVSVNAGTQPSWMLINGSTGAITANVAPERADSTYTMVVRATGSTTVDKTFTITTGTAADINDIPTTSSPAAQTVAEDAVLTFGPANFNFTDLDTSVGGSVANGATLVKIRIDTLPSHGTLKLNNVDVLAGDEIPETVLETLTYTSNTDYSGSDSYTYSVNDGIAWSATPTNMTITVTPSNDAPILVDGVPVLSAITEDAITNTDVGNLVSDLISRTGGGAVAGDKSGLTDVDTVNNGGAGNAPESVGMGIAIHTTAINGPSTGGVWQYKLVSGGNWTNFGSVSDSAALLLKSTDSVRFLPDGKNGQTASFDYYAWDQFSGSAGSTANVSSRGGSTAFSTASDSASITVTDVNDAPTIAKPVAQTVAEDATISIVGISFSDVDIVNRNDGGASNNNLSAMLSVLHGTITLAGTTGITVDAGADASNSVTITGSLSDINTAVATLVYAPGTDYSGAETLSLSVNDNGNVGSGGAQTTTDTLAITVTPTNDAPVLVDGRPTLTTITENDTNNAGNLVSDLIDRAGGGAVSGNKSGITDVDTLNNGGLGNVPESVGMGIALVVATNGNREAVDGVTADYGNGTGTWQYSIDNGINWVAVGTVSSTQALLLSATDKLRFVPNGENGTLGTLDYYLWDGANGTSHTATVDVRGGLRGNATPYSLVADRATLVVSNVNDAPVLDLDGNNSSTATGNSAGGGASFVNEFLVRGAAVAIADADISITDVDRKAFQEFPDTIASATVEITAGATDNLFGTTYETLAAARYQGIVDNLGVITVTGTLGNIIVSNSGTASISISGAGTWAEYQNIIKAITYQNANPNAFPGARTVTVTVVDSASTDTAAPATVSATSTITNVWAPSVDTNGVASGVTFTTAYTEGGAAVKIVTADATITDQDSHLKQVVVSISNVQNAGSETLTIPGGNGANWNGITGLTVSGSGTSTITLTGDLPPNDYQLALRSISYANSSDAPITTQRDITVVATDIQNHVGDTGHSYINLTAVNDAPVLGVAGATFTAINEDNSASTGNTVAQLIADGRITDPDLSSGVPKAIAVSAVDNTNGTWQYKVAAGAWTVFDFTANSGKALLLDSTDSVRFVPTADWNGTVASGVTFYAWDKTSSAVAGDYQTISGNTGGEKILSTATGTAALTVNAVNDAPVMTGTGSNMTGINEDATGNAGQAVSALLATVTDIDSATQGLAVYSTTVTGPTSGGKWQYNVSSGGWTDFGTVSESTADSGAGALLLKSTDLVRFVPDTKNGQTASFDYYAWDQYSGTAGSKVDASIRSGVTPFSTASDSVSITVTDLNDAPVLDLNTGTVGTDYSTNFLVRSGVGVAIANPSAISISDVDVTAANVPESIAGATVEITGGAVDNTFGTIYEKLTSGSGASVTSSLGNTIAITGSGTPSITISGAGTPTEYQNIIKAITYENANPNAYTGARTVTVTLTDSALTGGSAGTAAATTTITNLWAPVVDTNGVATTLVTINGVEQEIGAGVKYVTSYTQGGSPVKVATADATITDEDSYLKSVVVSIHDAAEGLVANDYEKLTITLGNTSNWNGMGLTVSGSGTDTITLTGNLPPSIYQLALRSISYANTAPAPGEVTRTINVVATDVDNHIGYTGHTDINVIPVNSPPTLAAVTSGSVAETALSSITTDSGLTGTLVGSDVETVAGSLVYGISGGTAGTGDDLGKVLKVGTYGTLKVTTAGGAYAYVKNSDAIDSLAQGATAHDDFTVTVSDGSLSNTSPPTNGPTRTLTINLTGANDAAIISGTSTASLTETDAALTTTGTLTSTDVDGTANLFSAQTDVAGSNGFGKFSITTGGVWTYTANNAHDEFVGSSSHTDSITVAAADGTTQVVTVTITGSNDAATFSGSSAGAVTEDSGSYSAAGTLTVSDVDSTVTVTAQDGTEGAYGSFSIGTDGAWTYTAVNSKLQALGSATPTATDTFSVTTADDTTHDIVITLTGVNDAPTLTAGAATATLVEAGGAANGTAGTSASSITLTKGDVDGTASYDQSAMTTTGGWATTDAGATYTKTGTYGTATLTVATDVVSYALNNSDTDTQALAALASASDSFTVYVKDDASTPATASVSAVFSITGANDAPTLTAGAATATLVEAGGVANAAAGTSASSITLTKGDVDGTASYDAAALGTAGWATSDAGVTYTKTGTYGTATLTVATDVVSYALNNSDTDTQALAAAASVSDSFIVQVTDGAAAANWETVFNITGSNDAPTLTAGAATATLVEAGGVANATVGISVSSITLTKGDVDGTASYDTTALLGAGWADGGSGLTYTKSGTFGTATLTISSGVVSYALNNSDTDTQALAAAASVSDSFTVQVTDGAATANVAAVFSITGANETPAISGTSSASATEAGHLDNGQAVLFGMGLDGLTHVTGALAASDPDTGATQTWSISDASPSTTYGALSINATTGVWDYALNNYLPATQALKEGDTVTVSYIARVTDDKGAYAEQTVTLTISGTNDVPVVANGAAALEGAVTEAGFGIAGSATASATLSSSDVDAGATAAWSLVGTPSSTYGSMALDASTGVWTYTLDNSKAATQALAAAQSVVETFTARVTDDKSAFVNQTISVTVSGSNDAPTVADVPGSAQSVFVGTVAALDDFTVADVDSNTLTVTLIASNGSVGGLTDADPGTAGIQLTGTAASINSAIAAATFTSAAAGAASISISVTDSHVVSATTATYSMMAAAAPVTPPPAPPPPPPTAPTVATPIPDVPATNPGPGYGTGTLTYPVPGGTFSDANGDTLTYSATKGDGTPLPAWLSFDAATRTFSGNPPGGIISPLTVKVTATDPSGRSTTDTFDWAFANTNDTPTVAHALPDQAIGGSGNITPYTVAANSFADADTGDSMSYSAKLSNGDPLPSWLSFDASSRTFSGNPPAGASSLTVRVTATDGSGATAFDDFVIALSGDLNDAPAVNGLPGSAQTVYLGSAAALDNFTVADADGDSLTVTLTASNGSVGGLTDADPGTAGIQLTGTAASINSAIAAATFTPTASGSASISISVTDSHVVSATTATYSMTAAAAPVTPPPAPPPTPTPTPITIDGTTGTSTTSTTGGQTTTTQEIVPVTAGRVEDTSSSNRTLADIPLATDSGGAAVVQVGLPVGVGLTTSASTTAAGSTAPTLRDQLVAASNAHVSDSTQQNQIIANGIDQYVPTVTDSSQVTVRTITLTVAAGTTAAPTEPIHISGSLGTGEGDLTHPLRQEALVIDASKLPSGTVLDLDNVEFAIIIGPATATGGLGRNYVIGDGSAQTIILGPDDDIIHGGGGNDVVGSKGGNDQLFGDDGNDTVVGGLGDDHLEGGAGDDLLVGGQGDAGQLTFTQLKNQVTMNWTPGSAELADSAGWSSTGNHDGGVAIDPRLAFMYQSTEMRETVAELYQAYLHRLPSLGDMNFWSASGYSVAELEQGVANLIVNPLVGQSTQQKVSAVLSQVWGADKVTPALVQSNTDFINAGGSWGQLMHTLIASDKLKAGISNTDGSLNLIQTTSIADSGWSFDAGNDTLLGGAGNDTLIGGRGNDLLDGGDGADIALWYGQASNFEVRIVTTGTTKDVALIDTSSGEVDIIRNIEQLQIGGVNFDATRLESVANVEAYLATHTDHHLQVVLVGLGN